MDTGSIGSLTVGADGGTSDLTGNVTTGTLEDLSVADDVTTDGSITVGHLISGDIGGDLDGLIEATGDGEIDDLSIGGNLNGAVLAAGLDANGDPIMGTGSVGRLTGGAGRSE